MREDVLLHGNRDFIGVIKVPDLNLEMIPDYLGGSQSPEPIKAEKLPQLGSERRSRRDSKCRQDLMLRDAGATCKDQRVADGTSGGPAGSHKEMGPPFYKELDSADT